MSNVNLQCENCGAYEHEGFTTYSPRCPICKSSNVNIEYDEDLRKSEDDYEVDDYDDQEECVF